MYKSLFLILFVFFVQTAHATIDWSWSFEPSSVEVGVNDLVPLDFSITNSLLSDAAIYPASFQLQDGSWGHPLGFIVNAAGAVLYTPTIFTDPRDEVIAPGETQFFRGASLTPFSSNLFSGQIVNVNPLFYVRDIPGNSPALPGKLSTNSIQIKITEIPTPSILWLCFFGLLMTKVITKNFKFFPCVK